MENLTQKEQTILNTNIDKIGKMDAKSVTDYKGDIFRSPISQQLRNKLLEVCDNRIETIGKRNSAVISNVEQRGALMPSVA